MKELILLLLAVVVSTHVCLGQESSNTVSGAVRNEKREPIQGVTVLAKSEKDSLTILGYSISDHKGSYNLQLPTNVNSDKFLLSFSILGYESQTYTLDDSQTLSFFDVTLTSKTIHLEKVIIREPRKGFRLKNDTTKFNISDFTDQTETNLESLLAKLPGIEVANGGVISFKGKKIEKILLSGDDFFSNDYSILSKNISADLLKGVEAIENYDDSKILKGLRSSDKVVLNVDLKSSGLSKVLGSIEAAAGNDSRYRISSSLFSLSDKFKIGLFLNKNTVGERAVSDISLDQTNGLDEVGNVPISFSLPRYYDIAENRYINNDVILSAIQLNYALNKRIKFTFNSTLNRNKQRVSNNEYLHYRLNDDETKELDIYNEYQHNLKNLGFNNNLTATVDINDRSELKYNGSYETSNVDLYQSTYRSDISQMIDQTNGKRINVTAHHLNYNNKINEFLALAVNYNFLYHNQPFDNYLFYKSLSDIPDIASSSLRQAFELSLNQSDLELKLYGSQKKYKFELGLKGKLDHADLQDKSDAFRPFCFKLTNKSLTAYLSAQRDMRQSNIGIALQVKKEYLSVKRFIPQEDFLFLQPKLWFEHNFSGKMRFRIDYALDNELSQLFQIYPHDIIINYMNVQKGSSSRINNNQTHQSGISLRYSDVNTQLIASFSSTYYYNSSPYINNIGRIDSLIFLNEYLAAITSTYYWRNQIQSDKYIRLLHSNLRTTIRHSNAQLASVIEENELRTNLLRSLYIGFQLNTAFLDKPINFNLGWNKSFSIIDGLESDLSQNTLSKYNIAGIWKPSKKITFKMSLDSYNWKSYSNKTRTAFLDAQLIVPFPKIQTKFTLSGHNLLNAREVSFTQNSNYLLSEGRYELTPRFVLFSFQYTLGTAK